MSHNDPHLTIEQFSDFINERLTPQEGTQVEEHLQQCTRCQEELTDLRQVVAMLRALPRPEPPRSFALPTDTKVTPLAAVTRRPSRLHTAGRAISLLAAVVGIALLLSSLISLPSGGAATMSTPASSGSVSPQARHHGPQPSIPSTGSTPSVIMGHATPTPQPQVAQTPSVQPLALPDLGSTGGRAILGILLLVIGLIGVLILWRRRYSLP